MNSVKDVTALAPAKKAFSLVGEFKAFAFKGNVMASVTETVAGEVVLTVNGAERHIPSRWTLADLLASLGLDARTVVVERNGAILRDRSSFASLELADDDTIEIVHFVGGG